VLVQDTNNAQEKKEKQQNLKSFTVHEKFSDYSTFSLHVSKVHDHFVAPKFN